MARQVTVTVADLDVTLEQMRAKGDAFDSCKECLIATAVTRTFGVPANCGLTTLTAGHVLYTIPAAAGDVISLFDNQAFDALRRLLPVTFPLQVLE